MGRKDIKEKGITRRETYHFDLDTEEDEKLLAELGLQCGIQAHMDSLEKVCQKVLEDNGYPSEVKKYPHPEKEGWLSNLDALVLHDAEFGGPAWFAIKILQKIWLVRLWAEKGHAWGAAESANELGQIFQEVQNKGAWEKYAIRGKKQIFGANFGREQNIELNSSLNDVKEMQDFANELFKENPKRTYEDIKNKVSEKFGWSTKTVQRKIKNPKKII